MTDVFKNLDAYIGTVARLFAVDGESDCVKILTVAETRSIWVSHDNWDGGYEVFEIYFDTPIMDYLAIEDRKSQLEDAILARLQAVTSSHTTDHIGKVEIVVKVEIGEDWRVGASSWLSKNVKKDSNLESHASPKPLIQCRPTVFSQPAMAQDKKQVAVMMPFDASFDEAYGAICKSADSVGLKARRADDIWTDSVIVQDIFSLIYASNTIIVDFTGKNPNVLYETGIAHTLGRLVIPITQSLNDVPFDLRHHRALEYLPNQEGLSDLQNELSLRLSTVTGRSIKKER